MISVLAPLPALLPLLGAGANLFLWKHAQTQRAISVVVLTAVLGVSIALLVLVDDRGTTAVDVGGWMPGVGISLVVDRLSALMLVVAATVTLGVLIYAIGQGIAGDDSTPLSIFHPTYLVLTAGVSNTFLTGDLFNLYVGFEVLLAASYVLLTLGGTGPRVRAGITYVVVSLLGSLIFLAGIAFTYAATGTLNMAEIAVRMDDVSDGNRLAIELVFLIAFGIKAAVFPLSAWLPDSYPTAAAPVTAVFAGLLTKVGVYAIIRTQTLLFPATGVDELLLVVAVATMLVGILGAVAQTDLKRMLSFTLVSHIGYMIFGIALDSDAGLAGAIYYVAHHILIQTALFLATGLVERVGGSTDINRLGGLATASPFLAVLFFVPAMNLSGIPPFSGFIGKVGLLQAGVDDGGALAYVAVGAAVLTSLLTLYTLAKVWGRAFWRPQEQATDAVDDLEPGAPGGDGAALLTQEVSGTLPRTMLASTVGLVAVTLVLTFAAGPFYDIADRAAVDLHQRDPYLRAVLPEHR